MATGDFRKARGILAGQRRTEESPEQTIRRMRDNDELGFGAALSVEASDLSDPEQERIPILLTREQAGKVLRWAVRNIRAIKSWDRALTDYEREELVEYREIDAAVNDAIAAQLRAQGEGE